MKKELKNLMIIAMEARNYAYCPYSNYSAGAALLCKDGRVTNCAERTAFFKAVSEGEKDFVAIAISGGSSGEDSDSYAYPCGVCRQVMREFCDEDKFKILVVKNEKEYEEYLLKDLLPKSFGPDNLGK